MAPMKRPAAAGSAGPVATKAARREDPNAAKVKAVLDAVLGAEGFPQEVLKMLAAGMENSLLTSQDQRHQFQADVVDMVGEVLASAGKRHADEVDSVAAKIGASDTEKASRDGALEAATQAAAQKLEVVELAKAALSEAATGVGHAKAAVTEGVSEQKSGDTAYLTASTKKAQLDGILAGDFAALKSGTSENVKRAVKAVTSAGRQFDMEAQLLTSAEAALAKPAGERGGFDSLVLEQLEDQLKSRAVAFEGQLAAGEAGKAERAAKVDAAQGELKTAVEKHAHRALELEAAQVALRSAEAEKKAAAKLLHDFGYEMEVLATEQERVRSEQRAAEEVHTLYTELKERTSVAEAAPAAEEVAEEQAAPAEVVAATS